MKPVSWIFTALLVTLLGAFWLRGLDDAPPEGRPEPAVSKELAGVPAPWNSGDRVAVGPERPAAPALAPHLVLANELWAVLGTGQAGHADRERALLVELVAEGSATAVEVVVEALEDPRCIHHGNGAKVRALFQHLEPSSGVFALAQRSVEQLVSMGSGPGGGPLQPAHLDPWFRIAAQHDTAKGTRFVLEHLLSDDPVVRKAAAAVASSLLEPEQRILVLVAFLTDLGLDETTLRNLAGGLVRSGDPALLGQLYGVALGQVTGGQLALALLDGTADAQRQAMLLEFLGAQLDANRLDDYLHLYRTSASEVLRRGVVSGLRRSGSSPSLDENTLDLVLGPFALELVKDGDELISGQGAELLRELEGLHDQPGARASLEARLAQGASANLAGILKSALARVD
ncbi:MAG: hypothetical protein O2816_02870 [Planctomycetota bacterium]|nr:hypothetical protein [Planctomycetota bacterium]